MNNSQTIYTLKDLDTKEFILYHHLGLGDHIICNGLVNYISTKKDKIFLPVNEIFHDQIAYLYSKNKKIKTLPFFVKEVNDVSNLIIKYSNDHNLPILKVGFESRLNQKTPFYKSFYKQLGLKYNTSYKYFNCPTNKEKESLLYSQLLDQFKVKNENYILVHDEASDENYNLKIKTELKKISLSHKYDIFNNIFFYRKLIMEASEIHCVNSSFAHLLDRFDTKGKRIYHDIRGGRLKFKKKWSYIDYRN